MTFGGNPILDAYDLLSSYEVSCILIGGAAAILHGSAYLTQDIDFCCQWGRGNLDRTARALNAVHARFRVAGIPEGAAIPDGLSAQHFLNATSLSFITDVGNIDLRKTVDGIGLYDDVLALSERRQIGGRSIAFLSIEGLLRSKKAMGRPRDLALLPELEMMQEASDIGDDDA